MSLQHSVFVRKAANRRAQLQLWKESRVKNPTCSFWVSLNKVYGVEASTYEKFMIELFSSDQLDNISGDCSCVICWYEAFFKFIAHKFEFAQYLDRYCAGCNLIHVSYRRDFKLVFKSHFKGEVDINVI